MLVHLRRGNHGIEVVGDADAADHSLIVPDAVMQRRAQAVRDLAEADRLLAALCEAAEEEFLASLPESDPDAPVEPVRSLFPLAVTAPLAFVHLDPDDV